MELTEILKDRPYNYESLIKEAEWQVEHYQNEVHKAKQQLKLREMALQHLRENKFV
jgi:hypothetical protein